MSKCISQSGEFSEHLLDGRTLDSQFVCARCLAFDEEAAEARIDELHDLLRNAARERDEWEANAEEANQIVERVNDIIADWGRRPPEVPLLDLWCEVKDAIGERYSDRRVCPNGCGTSWSPRSVLTCPSCGPNSGGPLTTLAGVPDALEEL